VGVYITPKRRDNRDILNCLPENIRNRKIKPWKGVLFVFLGLSLWFFYCPCGTAGTFLIVYLRI
jgi:hypothetical protein